MDGTARGGLPRQVSGGLFTATATGLLVWHGHQTSASDVTGSSEPIEQLHCRLPISPLPTPSLDAGCTANPVHPRRMGVHPPCSSLLDEVGKVWEARMGKAQDYQALPSFQTRRTASLALAYTQRPISAQERSVPRALPPGSFIAIHPARRAGS